MRIGMMLRAYDEAGGVGVYTRNLVKELLEIDRHNSYVLFYRSAQNLGQFAAHPNVEERVVWAPNKALWDQVFIPYHCWREKLDVILHPKFTVPLFAPCKAVMVVHGADWFMPDQAVFYGRWDVAYIRAVMPYYFKKAAVVLSVSELTAENFYSVLELPPGKIKTVYFGPARHFARVHDQDRLAEVRTRYDLPERFILTLTKRGGAGRKNLSQLLKSYARYHAAAQAPRKLVIGGKDCHLFRNDYEIFKTEFSRDILFPGWIDQQDLPAVYSLADLYFYPSNLEAFPIPLTEAMACGTPLVTSDANGLREIAGDAALFVDPADDKDMAKALIRVFSDDALRADLSAQGLARSKTFNWQKCARETLEILEGLGVANQRA
jgi:glycosyltransferase involved in cell wall biosynthesis